MRFVFFCLPVALGFGSAPTAFADSGADFLKEVKPFLQRHCTSCHGERQQKGDLRLDTLGYDFARPGIAGHWMEIMDRINSGDMPPRKEPRPKGEEVARVAEWIAGQLAEAEASSQGSNEKVSFRRLTRDEYRHTIHDLLGTTYDAHDPTGLPEDPDWQGFERIGSVLTLSPAHVEKYLAAAETVLGEALALEPQPKRTVIRWGPASFGRLTDKLEKELTAQGLIDKARVDIVPNNGANSTPGDSVELKVAVTGDYLVRVKLSGLRPKDGRSARLLIYAATFDRVLFEQDVEAPEDRPITLQFRTHLPAGVHRIRVINAVPGPNPEGRYSRAWNGKPFFKLNDRLPWQLKLTDDDGLPIQPILLLDWVEWDGPIYPSWPPPAHRQIFFEGDKATKNLVYARAILERFATRAYRRPAQPAEIDRLLKLVHDAQKLGDNFESSVKTALLAVLCSKNFLFLVEGSADVASPNLTDRELASRLSYFLWSTMPDDRLFELARQNKLHVPATLREEVRRMMRDPKADRFAESFPRQWLQLRRVGMFAPDKKLYPDYDDYLEKSMIAESTGYFREVLARNLGLRELLDSDWTMLNERLAGHYGITGVRGESLRRVALQPGDHRGGLLTQAAVLSLTSDGTRHRPVHRGKWLLETLYGKPPPPPPANVGDIKPTPANLPKSSLRAKLEAHRDDANCAACHRKIDPLGLAFDNYDAVGRWRTEEVVRDGMGANPKLDPSGELPDGRRFADARALKKLLVADLDRFAPAFCEKVACYALRRRMTYADRALLKRIVEQAKADDYRLAALIETLATSELFMKR